MTRGKVLNERKKTSLSSVMWDMKQTCCNPGCKLSVVLKDDYFCLSSSDDASFFLYVFEPKTWISYLLQCRPDNECFWWKPSTLPHRRPHCLHQKRDPIFITFSFVNEYENVKKHVLQSRMLKWEPCNTTKVKFLTFWQYIVLCSATNLFLIQ